MVEFTCEEIKILNETQYSELKTVADVCRHPSFLGRKQFSRCAINGGAFLFLWHETVVAFALVDAKKNNLLAFGVVPKYRGQRIGETCIKYLNCNFARVLESAVPFFEKCGYQKLGELKKGKRLYTAVMVKKNLSDRCGRLRSIFGNQQVPSNPKETTSHCTESAK